MTGFVTKKLSHDRSLGATLKAARTKLKVTLKQAEKETRIPMRHLVALEEGNYTELPCDAYNLGYVRTYAQFLKLKEDKVIDQYRRERSVSKLAEHPASISLRPSKSYGKRFFVTPKLIGTVVALAVFGAIVSYTYVELEAFAAPPTISLKTPAQFTSASDTTNLTGQTASGAIVLVNSQEIAVDPSGKFSQQVQLTPGVNHFVIEAKNLANKESQIAVQVLYTQQGVASLPLGAEDATTD